MNGISPHAPVQFAGKGKTVATVAAYVAGFAGTLALGIGTAQGLTQASEGLFSHSYQQQQAQDTVEICNQHSSHAEKYPHFQKECDDAQTTIDRSKATVAKNVALGAGSAALGSGIILGLGLSSSKKEDADSSVGNAKKPSNKAEKE